MKTHRPWSRSLLLAGVVVSGCTPRPDYLFVDPGGRGVRVELRHSVGVFRKREEPVPLSECGFYAATHPVGAGRSALPQEIWRIVSTSSDRSVLAVRYGIVPEGFVQATPAGDAPPPLEPGRRYTVECSGDAIGVTEFEFPKLVTRPEPGLKKREP